MDKPTPNVYIGYFYDDKFNGNGILFNDKGKFDGTFMDNKKSGFGTFYFKNGVKFEGTYLDNKKNGIGRISNPQGKVILTGKWNNDEPPSQDEPE